MEIAFWILTGVLVYTYVGYGIIITFLNFILRRKKHCAPPVEVIKWPSVTMIMACFNEEDYIEQKFQNCLKLLYPGPIKFIWVTDGSTDRTNSILHNLIIQEENHELLWEPARKGKTHAMNRAVSRTDSEIIIFSDCNTILNPDAILHMVKHFHDPKVGAVSGAKNVEGVGEGLYWKYENYLKEQDSKFWTQVGTPGELFAVRNCLYLKPPEDSILDDFMISMAVAKNNYRVIHENLAQATESGTQEPLDEWKRKIRIGAGGVQSMIRLSSALIPVRINLKTWWQYISHRVLRWSLAPLSLPILLILNCIILFTTEDTNFWSAIFGLQLLFWTFGALGWIGYQFPEKKIYKYFTPIFYFQMMNAAVIVGWINYFKRKTNLHIWQKVKR